MIGRALDSNNDLIIEDGSLKLVRDAAEVVQHVRTRLLFYKGEWFLDTLTGVPYYQEIFTKPANLGNTESILKSTIIQTPGIEQLTNFAMDYQGGSIRNLGVTAKAETVFGDVTIAGVTVNA